MKRNTTLSEYLRKCSKEICADINADLQVLDICISDYFQGSSSPVAAIPLPWAGTQRELAAEVKSQISELEAI